MSSSSGLIELLMPPSLLARRIFFGMTHYLIYKISNLVNGKFYIGQHKTDNLEDNYWGSGFCIRNAIKKYGIENFVFEVLIDLKNEEEMNLLEELVVNEEFIKRDDVYNLKTGGSRGKYSFESRMKSSMSHKGQKAWNKGIKMSEEFVQKNRMSHIGQKAWNKGKTNIYSAETKKKMSKNRIGKCCGDENPRAMLGKHHTDEAKLRIGKAARERPSGMKGKHHSNATKAKMREKSLGNRANSGMKWWNNGSENAMSFECPPGFVKGRLKKKKLGD